MFAPKPKGSCGGGGCPWFMMSGRRGWKALRVLRRARVLDAFDSAAARGNWHNLSFAASAAGGGALAWKLQTEKSKGGLASSSFLQATKNCKYDRVAVALNASRYSVGIEKEGLIYGCVG
jgi:hypothetical protein